MAATCVFIGCDVMLLDLLSDVWILVVGGGEEDIKVLLKKRDGRQVGKDARTDGTKLEGMWETKLTCRWAIALNMMRLFSHSMLLRASSAEGTKPAVTLGCSTYIAPRCKLGLVNGYKVNLWNESMVSTQQGLTGTLLLRTKNKYLHFWIFCRYFRASTITWAMAIWCFLCCWRYAKRKGREPDWLYSMLTVLLDQCDANSWFVSCGFAAVETSLTHHKRRHLNVPLQAQADKPLACIRSNICQQ